MRKEDLFFKGYPIDFPIPFGVNIPIYVIGDSHVNVLCQAAPHIFKKSIDITTAIYESKSAYAIGSKGHDYYLNEALNNIPVGAEVLLSFGEIDCRHYVPKMAIEHGTSIEYEVDEVLKRYIPNCVRLLKQRFRVMILGAYICPQDKTNTNSFTDIFEAKRLINIKLKDYCNTVGILFIPIFEQSLDNNWHDKEIGTYFNDDSHLGPCMIPVILDSMVGFKWNNFDYSEPMETIMFAEKIPVTILKFRRDKHDFELGWEREYLDELIATLKPGMTVIDVGAENGEFTAMAAKIVGGNNVHIFEPSKQYWPNIFLIWSANGLSLPAGVFCAYVGSRNEYDFENGDGRIMSIGNEIFYDTNHATPESVLNKTISLDYYTSALDIKPDVVMMDIEGAELDAILGSKKMIEKCSPIFFISIHADELIKQRSGGTKDDILELFNDFGYIAKHIHTDHEEHWKFYKP